MKSPLCFTDLKIIAVPATGFINDSRLLRTIQAVLVRKERFDPVSVLKNYLKVHKRVQLIYTGFQAFRDFTSRPSLKMTARQLLLTMSALKPPILVSCGQQF